MSDTKFDLEAYKAKKAAAKAEDKRIRRLAPNANHFEFEETDCDIRDGWIDYYPTNDVPEEVEMNGESVENLSSITVDFDYDINWEYDSGTYIDVDGHGGWYERPGNYVDSVDFNDTSVRFIFDGEEITREKFTEINKLTTEDVDAMVGWCIVHAEGYVEDYITDNPDEFE